MSRRCRKHRQTTKGTTTQNKYQKVGWGRILQASCWGGRNAPRGQEHKSVGRISKTTPGNTLKTADSKNML